MIAAHSRQVRVLFVAAANSTAGGGEKHVADLLRHMPEKGIDCALLAPAGGDLGELAADSAIRRFEVPIDAGFSAGRVKAVRRAIDEFEPDVVHAHGSRAAMFARLADRIARDRVVYTLHGIHVDQAGSAIRRNAFMRVERFLRPRTARFVTVARSDIVKGERLGILDRQRTVTVYNGIEVPVPLGRPGGFRGQLSIAADAPLILSVGRFHEQKDQRTLVAAFARLHDRVGNARLVLVGSGVLESALREQVLSLGISNVVSFERPRASLADAYVDADVVALSSRWEGLPYVVLEAMAYGKPVVSTDVDGIPEAVVQGETGLLVDPGDPEALGAALVEVLNSADRGRAMGESGRRVVEERFSIHRMMTDLLRVYAAVLEGVADA